jgi:tRNA threonylcarbamoyladenosine biosynthesis protein TsaE
VRTTLAAVTAYAIALRTTGPQQTQQVAAAIASMLRAGDVVALTGELGAGKTCFVQGAAAALGVTDPVTSPSFLLRRDYRGRVPVIHLDVYRLETLQEVVDLGYADVLDSDSVAFIEWGDAMSQLLPVDHLEVELRLGELGGPVGAGAASDLAEEDVAEEDFAEERFLVLRAHGDGWRRRLTELSVELAPWRLDGTT